MATIDLSNYPIIKNNQEGSCQISAMIGLHGIDLAETKKSMLLTTLTTISTTLQVVGQDMLNYTGYAVINDEIVYVNNTVAIGDNLSLSILRGMNGTVAQTLSSINRDYIYPIQLFFPNTYDYSSKTDISDSDLWGISLDNGKCQIIDNPDNWNYFNSSKLYNKYINKEIFIFEGINGQFIKTYEGVTTRINTDSTNVIEIEFSDNSAKTYNESLDSNKYYNNVTLKELLENVYPEQRVQYVADTNEADYPIVRFFTLGDFETYSAMLSYICKQFAVRIVFRKNNTIFVFSDVMQENLIAQEEMTAFDIVDITDSSSGQLVINDAEGTYIYRKSFVNEDDYDSNNKYTKWNFNKTFTGSFTVLETSSWKEVTFTGMSELELSYISYENYVMLKDVVTNNEYIGRPSSINVTTGILKVAFGIDKYQYWDELGRLAQLPSTITLVNPVLYYSPNSKPIIAKFGLNVDGEDKAENLKFPIVAGEEHLFYLNFSATTSNDNKFTGICLGNYVTTEDSRFNATNGYADNSYLTFGKEYYQNSIDFPLYLYSSKIDTNYDDRIAVSTLNNEDVLVKTEWSDDSKSNLKVTLKNNIAHNMTEYTVLGVNDNVIRVSSTTYNVISAGNCIRLKGMNTSDIGYTTYLNYRYITFCITSKSTDGSNYYLTLDTKYPDKVMDVYLSFNIINNATKHSITEWVSQSAVKVDSTTFNTLKVGDCLKLAGILSSDTRYDRYLEYKEARFLVVGKLNEGGIYYIYLNTDYPRKYGYANFDFVRFPREQVILINEFYIRGNPIMEYTNSYSFDDEESKKLYGSKKYSLDGKNLSQEDFSKIAGYVFKTYAGTNVQNMRTKLDIEIPCRFDLEVGNIISLTDSVATKYDNQKCMIIGKYVNYSESGRDEKYTLLTIGNYSTSANSINISSTSGFSPVVIPTYSHTGGEGTTSQTTNQNISNKSVILYDDTEGTITIQEIDVSEFCAYVNGGISADSLSAIINVDNISSDINYRKNLLRDTAEGVIKVNNEYIAYKCSGGVTSDSASLVTQKRGLGNTTISAIADNQKIKFYKILSKISADGIISSDILLGNGVDNYIKVSTENGVEIVGSVTITGGQTYDDLEQYTSSDSPNGVITLNPVGTGTATSDGNVLVDLSFSYTQGTWLANNLLVYIREGGGTVVSTDKNYIISTTATSMRFSVKPNTTYSFGIQPIRTNKVGTVYGNITNSADITTINSNYTANINGTVASTVVSNASNGNTAFSGTVQYRGDVAPSNNGTLGTVTTLATTDGNIVATIPYSYTQGTNKATHLLIYYKEGGGTVVNTNPSIIVSATSSGNITLNLKPSTSATPMLYSFGIQAIATTVSGYVGYATIASSSNYTMPIGNYTGLLQTDNTSNYLYQNTTVKMGKNAISSGNDGLYVGNTDINSNPTNYMKFNTTAGTFDLKSTGNINISNTGNELNFDSTTSTNSKLSMNNGKQQIGLCTDSNGSYQGLFVGDTTLSNGKYVKYNGTDLTVGKNTKFNWIDTLSADSTQSLQELMNKTYDQMLKGTTTYKDNLITIRSGGVGTEKAYLGNMGVNGFGLKIDSDSNNYFYANTVDGVKLRTNKDVNIKNTTNELNFDSTTSTNSFISMNNGSQQIGKVTGLTPLEIFPSVTIPDFNGFFVGDKILNRKNYMYYDSTGLNFKGKYFNGIAYCSTVDDFIGALHGKQYIYTSGGILNPYYGKEVNGIILTEKSYVIPTLTTYPFDNAFDIIPQESISFITSLGGSGGTEACVLNFASKNLILNYDIEIANMQISTLGNTSNGSALTFGSNGITIKDIRFLDLNGYIECYGYVTSSIQNIRIISYNVNNTFLIKNARNISNVSIIADNLTIPNIVYFMDCTNINNVYIFNSATTKYELSKVTIFSQCYNIQNIFISDNYYKCIANRCININNFYILEPGSLTYTLNSYYFYKCYNISNINFVYYDLHNYKFSECERINNCNGSYNRASLSSCNYDVNNTWNVRRNIVTDAILPTAGYNTYTSKLIPQLLHVYIKESNTRFVTDNTDLDIDNTRTGSYGLYKFIYNNSLSQWELHQLIQSIDISGGNLIYIKFSITGEGVIFSVKSETSNKYITILAEEIK